MAVFSLVSPKSANQSSDSISEYNCIVDNSHIKVIVYNPNFLPISIQIILYVKKGYLKLSVQYSHLLHMYGIFLAATSSSLQSTVHLIINIGLLAAIKIITYLPCHGTVTLIPDRPSVQDLLQPACFALYSMRSTTSLGSFLAGISASARSRRMSNPAVTIIRRGNLQNHSKQNWFQIIFGFYIYIFSNTNTPECFEQF